jgi:hypothetical protein
MVVSKTITFPRRDEKSLWLVPLGSSIQLFQANEQKYYPKKDIEE